MARTHRGELSDRAKQCFGQGLALGAHVISNMRCLHCGEAERTIRARDKRRCGAHRECAVRGVHAVHRRKPTKDHPEGKIITAAELTVPLPLVDTRPQEDRAAPEMPDGPALYIWDFPLALHLSRDAGTSRMTPDSAADVEALCGAVGSLRTRPDRKRSAPLDKICGHCRIEASKMRGMIR